MKHALGALALLLFGFGSVTFVALESGGVAVITTRAEDGTSRATHVWFVEQAGELWLEAGTPENPWFLDIGREPELAFSAGSNPIAVFSAKAVPEPSAKERVRAALHEKYGWRDSWVGLFVAEGRSVAVRLSPIRG